MKNPQRNIPIAILGAVLIGFILYFMLQLSFIAAMPQKYLVNGWQALSYPGDSGPLVGLTSLLGLGVIALLLMFDAAFPLLAQRLSILQQLLELCMVWHSTTTYPNYF